VRQPVAGTPSPSRVPALVFGVVILAAAVTASALAVKAPTLHFTNTVLLRPEGGTEPAIAIAADATMAITALNPTVPLDFGYTNLWKGTFGSTPAYQGPIDARIEGSYGGADADVDLGTTGTLHVTTLVGVLNPNLTQGQLGISSITCPGADTSDHYAHCVSQLIDTTQTDRPFVASDGREVYIIYHDSGNSAAIRVQRSDDDGISWRRVGDVTMGLGQVTAGATYNNDLGPIVVDPRTHVIYALFSSGTTGLNKASTTEIIHNKVYIASSTDLGQHWTANLVYEASPQTNFGNPFATGLAIDPLSGNLFVAVSDGSLVYFSKSTNGGRTWSSRPTILNSAPARTALFPEVAAYGGIVDVVFYGTPAASKDDPAAVWNVYMAKSSDGGGQFVQSAVTAVPNHVGRVCTKGDACFVGDRTLADLFEIALNPKNRLAAIAYATDTVGEPFRITSGPRKGTYRAAEGTFTKSLLTLPGALMRGGTTYVGLACPGDAVPPAVEDGDPSTQEIAVIMRGNCLFKDKAQSVLDAGYDGFVVFNYAQGDHGGDEVFPMGGVTYRDIPGEMVGHSTGLAIFNASTDAGLVVRQSGAPVSVGRLRVQAALAQEVP
jgi:hypothetical protein